MIFVTVGTHEQQFNRLLKYMDDWAKTHNEEVVVQTGYSNYVPSYCRWKKIISYEEMIQYVKNARIVITHGGPSSFLEPLKYGKIPIVVPRMQAYKEHVNDHQVDFCEQVNKRIRNIILVKEISELGNAIGNYDNIISNRQEKFQGNNGMFCERFSNIVKGLFK